MYNLRTYQQDLIDKTAEAIANGNHRIVMQMPTGGGKTPTFVSIAFRYAQKSGKKVLVLVDREELLMQAVKAFSDWFGVIAYPIQAGTKTLPDVRFYVGMVETVNSRMKKKPNFIPKDIGLLIADEAHVGNFKKVYKLFPESLLLGVTATAVSAKKKDPLNKYFEDIVTSIDTPDLINLWLEDNTIGLVPNKTIELKGVDRRELSIKNGEFDETQMSVKYSSSKNIKNTIEGYERFAKGKKAIVFNCNIAHSKLVNEAFMGAGYPSKHMDGSATTEERKRVLKWFKDTPGAVLNSVFLFTKGFDEPSVEACLVNKATMSLTAWLQMTGRSARPFKGKREHIHLDFGGNARVHGDWSTPRDWNYIFHNPDKANEKLGVSPMKECENPPCSCLIPAQARFCKFCGYVFPIEEKIDTIPAEFEDITGIEGLVKIKGKMLSELTPEELAGWAMSENQRSWAMRVAKAKEQQEKGWLYQYAKHMGYKSGWVFKQMQDIKTQRVTFFDKKVSFKFIKHNQK